jgi:hypothetical protein
MARSLQRLPRLKDELFCDPPWVTCGEQWGSWGWIGVGGRGPGAGMGPTVAAAIGPVLSACFVGVLGLLQPHHPGHGCSMT